MIKLKSLLIPLFAIFIPYLIYNRLPFLTSSPIKGVVVGALVGLACFLGMTYLTKEGDALKKSVLCGLIAGKFAVVEKGKFPDFLAITFWLFLYFYSLSH